MPRRIPDYNVVFADWNLISSIGAFGMFVTPFLMGFILWRSLRTGEKAQARAWEGARGAAGGQRGHRLRPTGVAEPRSLTSWAAANTFSPLHRNRG